MLTYNLLIIDKLFYMENQSIENKSTLAILPEFRKELKNQFVLLIYHDGLDITTIYVKKILDKFKDYFHKVYLLLEDYDVNVEILNEYDTLAIVKNIRPINLEGQWALILQPGEFPSIQLLNNFENILNNTATEIKIIKLPLVICDFQTGDILDVLETTPRLFKQNPQLLSSNSKIAHEVDLEECPIIKFYVDSERLVN